MKPIVILLILFTIFSYSLKNVFAQTQNYQLSPSSSQYATTGSIVLEHTNNLYTYSASVSNLPSKPPNNGTYYILWATNQQGLADNLNTINNNSKINGNLDYSPSNFFITSEKERFPATVSSSKIVQTSNILTSTIATSTPIPTATASANTPTGAPDTGFGGSLIWNSAIAVLFLTGLVGIIYSVRNKTA